MMLHADADFPSPLVQESSLKTLHFARRILCTSGRGWMDLYIHIYIYILILCLSLSKNGVVYAFFCPSECVKMMAFCID